MCYFHLTEICSVHFLFKQDGATLTYFDNDNTRANAPRSIETVKSAQSAGGETLNPISKDALWGTPEAKEYISDASPH